MIQVKLPQLGQAPDTLTTPLELPSITVDSGTDAALPKPLPLNPMQSQQEPRRLQLPSILASTSIVQLVEADAVNVADPSTQRSKRRHVTNWDPNDASYLRPNVKELDERVKNRIIYIHVH